MSDEIIEVDGDYLEIALDDIVGAALTQMNGSGDQRAIVLDTLCDIVNKIKSGEFDPIEFNIRIDEGWYSMDGRHAYNYPTGIRIYTFVIRGDGGEVPADAVVVGAGEWSDEDSR